MQPKHGVTYQWSSANQAYLVFFDETLLRVINTKAELKDYLQELGAIPRRGEKFTRAELAAGISREMEHTDDPKTAARIARDHLEKDPEYYTHLAGCGLGNRPKKNDETLGTCKVCGEITELRPDGLCGPCGYAAFLAAVSVGWRFKCHECHQQGIVARRQLGCPACGDPTVVVTWKQIPKKNPQQKQNLPNGLHNAYTRFHGVEPQSVTVGRLWTPGGLVCLGPALTIGYDVRHRSSKKGAYIHEHHSGVKVYRRAKSGERADLTLRDFPRDLFVLGDNLGFSYEDEDGRTHEVRGSSRRKLATNTRGNILVVIGPTGVDFLLRGGKLKVTDWIRN